MFGPKQTPARLDEHLPALPLTVQEALKRDLAADTLIKYAQKVRDWPMLHEAVEQKIKDQREFIAVWNETVTPRRGAGRGNKTVPDRGQFSAADGAEAPPLITRQQVSRWKRRLAEPDKYREMLYGGTYAKAMAEEVEGNHRAQGTGENEWYTPDEYLDLARSVLGSIDLDPASSEAAQRRVRAAEFFTKAENGLERDWNGCVWLNPPYTQPDIALFVSKMVSEWNSGRIEAAIMLTHNYTDTAWFHEAANGAAAICFTRGRIKFYSDDGSIAAPTQGQAFFYFGDDQGAFARCFEGVGFVMSAYGGGEVAHEAA